MKYIFRLQFIILLIVFASPLLIFGQANTAYAILVDNTGTMRSQFSNVQSLSNAIIQNSVKRGFVSLYAFDNQFTSNDKFARIASRTTWSQDKNILEQDIADISVVGGQTVLFDAISSVVKNTAAKADSEGFKEKIVVLITDGEDRASRIKEKDLINEVKASGVKIYVVGLTGQLDSLGPFLGESSKSKATKFLKNIAKESGGNAIFPKLKEDTKVENVLAQLFAESSKI